MANTFWKFQHDARSHETVTWGWFSTKYVMNYIKTTLMCFWVDEAVDVAGNEHDTTSLTFSLMASHFLSVTATLESNLSNNTKLYTDVDLQHVFSMRSITCGCIYIPDHELLAEVHISNSQKAVCAYSTYAGRNSSNIGEEVDQVRGTCSRNRKLYFGSLLKVHQDLCAIFSSTSEGCEPLSFVSDGGRHIFR